MELYSSPTSSFGFSHQPQTQQKGTQQFVNCRFLAGYLSSQRSAAEIYDWGPTANRKDIIFRRTAHQRHTTALIRHEKATIAPYSKPTGEAGWLDGCLPGWPSSQLYRLSEDHTPHCCSLFSFVTAAHTHPPPLSGIAKSMLNAQTTHTHSGWMACPPSPTNGK